MIDKAEIKQFKQEADFNQFGIWFNDKRHQLGIKVKREFIIVDYTDVIMWSIGNSFKRVRNSTFRDVLIGQIFLGSIGAVLGALSAGNSTEKYYKNPTFSLDVCGRERSIEVPTGLGTFKQVSFRGYLFQKVTKEIKNRLTDVVEYYE